MSLTLYYHPLSSFCHKVLIALYEHGVEFEPHTVNLGDAAERAELAAMWPITKFPVLRDHARERNVAESTIIIEYLDRHFAGAHPLIPSDWDQALEVRLWDRILDNYVHLPMQQIVADKLRGSNGGTSDERSGDTSGERSRIATAYGMIDRQLASRTWVAGQGFSMADCAATPALFYAHTLVPFPDGMDHLKAYFERLMERPSVRRVMEEAKPFFSFYPFADAIPQRFR